MDDYEFLVAAIELASSSPPAPSAFSVGALIVSGGVVIATGYSRETDAKVHAEEAALAKLSPSDPRLATATVYSSLEPCSKRASRPLTCAQLILRAGVPRVVFAWREPAVFVDCEGAGLLAAAGVEVVEMPELAPLVQATNAHLAP
jgi:diaminohydroxyphosphoribosylaminopyrimidine deaminase/5-amino-6-(5-phosphoribosylamino)uracil reductase